MRVRPANGGSERTAGTRLVVKPLGGRTWPAFARTVEKHHGIWGGCWCVAFHRPPGEPSRTAGQNKAEKERLVRANRTHAAVVFEGRSVVGWCQFGPPSELPARMTAYAKLGVDLPDWRVTCFFVDRDRRGVGVAKAALDGALRMIAAEGGGTVDGYPLALGGKRTSNSFVWAGTASMFEARGFRRIGALGPTKTLMRKDVRPRRS